MKIFDAEKKWENYCARFTDGTRKVYGVAIRRFLKSLPLKIDTMEAVRSGHVRDFLDCLMATGVKNVTYNFNLTILHSFFRFVHKYYDLDNPMEQFEPVKQDPPEARFLTEDEFAKIKSVVGPERERDRAVFIANTGLRVNEFCHLEQGNFAPGYTSLTIVGKGRKRRTIPLNETCRALLVKYAGQINYHKGELIDAKRMRYECNLLAKLAGIPDYYPHSLRHYFATALLTRGVLVQHVSKLLGHSSSTVTEQVYVHILPEHLQDVTECLVCV